MNSREIPGDAIPHSFVPKEITLTGTDEDGSPRVIKLTVNDCLLLLNLKIDREQNICDGATIGMCSPEDLLGFFRAIIESTTDWVRLYSDRFAPGLIEAHVAQLLLHMLAANRPPTGGGPASPPAGGG